MLLNPCNFAVPDPGVSEVSTTTAHDRPLARCDQAHHRIHWPAADSVGESTLSNTNPGTR